MDKASEHFAQFSMFEQQRRNVATRRGREHLQDGNICGITCFCFLQRRKTELFEEEPSTCFGEFRFICVPRSAQVPLQ